MLHRVHGNRHAAHRPGHSVGPQQRHGHGEAMVDLHFLAGGQVELVGHQRFDQVPGELRVAGERRHRLQSPALVGVGVLRRGADREGRHLVEEEIQAMIVVDHDGDIGPHPLEPGAHRRVAVEKRLPVRLILHLPRDRIADGRDMRAGNSADDGGHGSAPRRRQPCLEVGDAGTGLLGTDVLDVEAEGAGELGQVVDIAACGQQRRGLPGCEPPRAAARSGRSGCSTSPRRAGTPSDSPHR